MPLDMQRLDPRKARSFSYSSRLALGQAASLGSSRCQRRPPCRGLPPPSHLPSPLKWASSGTACLSTCFCRYAQQSDMQACLAHDVGVRCWLAECAAFVCFRSLCQAVKAFMTAITCSWQWRGRPSGRRWNCLCTAHVMSCLNAL